MKAHNTAVLYLHGMVQCSNCIQNKCRVFGQSFLYVFAPACSCTFTTTVIWGLLVVKRFIIAQFPTCQRVRNINTKYFLHTKYVTECKSNYCRVQKILLTQYVHTKISLTCDTFLYVIDFYKNSLTQICIISTKAIQHAFINLLYIVFTSCTLVLTSTQETFI